MRKLLTLALALAASALQAQTITPGFTFAVASDGSNAAIGHHYHSNTGGAFGNPAGKAEVGNYFSEYVRGLSEYDLTGLTASPTAFVTFNVFKAGGLFTGANDFPFAGTINVVAYQGDNTEDISDYQAASIGSVGSFGTGGLVVGNVLSFDIASIFNSAIAGGWTSLGMRLEVDPGTNPNGGAWTFDTFRLTSNNQTSVTTPEPATFTLLGAGLLLTGLAVRRRARR